MARLAFFVLALAACGGPTGGTDVGNGRTLAFDVNGYEDGSFSAPQSLTLANGVLIETAFVALERIRFEPAVNGSCDEVPDGLEVDLEGPVVGNLVGAGVLGQVPAFTTESGAFCELSVGYHPVDLSAAPPGTPAELDGLSLRVTGERADGAAFVVESRSNETLELETSGGAAFELGAGSHTLFLAYELSSWITALDLEGLGPGPIVIDDDQNVDRLEAFEAAVAQSARLFRDQNGDGTLSSTERQNGQALAE